MSEYIIPNISRHLLDNVFEGPTSPRTRAFLISLYRIRQEIEG